MKEFTSDISLTHTNCENLTITLSMEKISDIKEYVKFFRDSLYAIGFGEGTIEAYIPDVDV